MLTSLQGIAKKAKEQKKHRFQDLYRMLNEEFLLDCWRDIRKDAAYGVDKVSAEEYEQNVRDLVERLKRGRYRAKLVRRKYIPRGEGKMRPLGIPSIEDKLLQVAVKRILEAIYEQDFLRCSYGYRPNVGALDAVDKLTVKLQFGRYNFVVEADIKSFFPSIDHAVLRSLLARRIRDPDTMGLIDLILASGVGVLDSEYTMQWFPGDDLMAALRPRGLPIGNLTSQFWANVYLHELDKFVKHSLRWPAYLRYSDDFLLFGDDKADLHRCRVAIADFLVPLRLRLHERKCVVFPTETGVDFVGFRVYPTHLRLRRDNVRRFVRRMRRLQASYQKGEIDLDRVHASLQSWIAHSSYANTYRLRQRLFAQFIFNPPQRECNDAGITDFRQEL